MALLEVKNVSYSYDKNSKAVKDVSFCVEKGEFLAIIGHNGSGKSTLAKLLNGLLKPSNGEVVVDENFATTVPGVYAAGDCVAGIKQVAKAVSDGMTAAMSAMQYLRKKRG